MGSESEDSDHGNDSESPNAALKELAGDLEYVWGHTQKLSQQILIKSFDIIMFDFHILMTYSNPFRREGGPGFI